MTKPKIKPRNFVAKATQSGAGVHTQRQKQIIRMNETQMKDAIHRELHDLFYTIPPHKEDTDENIS